jgi:hypothetical protein
MNLVQKVFRVPVAVSETGHIVIVADQTNSPPNPFAPLCGKWDYKAMSYDPNEQKSFGSTFDVSAVELDKWNQECNR